MIIDGCRNAFIDLVKVLLSHIPHIVHLRDNVFEDALDRSTCKLTVPGKGICVTANPYNDLAHSAVI